MTNSLISAIHNIIHNSPQQAITFAEYMDLALYHPEWGYYSREAAEIGVQGDFFTASSLGSDFGELLAEQLIEMQNVLKLESFQIVEMGAGKGHLAKDILTYIQAKCPQKVLEIEYIILEKSPSLRQQQQQHLAELKDFKIRWCTWEDLENESIQGCFLSNELLDAFPVHRVVVNENGLQEIFITTAEDSPLGIKETTGSLSTTALKTYFETLGIDFQKYPQGYRTEVNLQMFDWLKTVKTKLKTGYILTIDYGYPAQKYYHPQRIDGTLQCYFQHRRHNDPYVNVGVQDLTAHVDFTSLQQQGEAIGLKTIGLTQQGLFLMALGLGDRLTALSQTPQNIMTIFQRRDALHQLIDPMGLGGFYVLLQGQCLTDTQLQTPLRGFTNP